VTTPVVSMLVKFPSANIGAVHVMLPTVAGDAVGVGVGVGVGPPADAVGPGRAVVAVPPEPLQSAKPRPSAATVRIEANTENRKSRLPKAARTTRPSTLHQREAGAWSGAGVFS
jgi:hypothetical protein